MKTLAERLQKETNGKGITEELFLSEMKKLSNLIITNTEAIKSLIATIGNEAKAREDKVISLLSANERLLIQSNKVFLQNTSGNTVDQKPISNNVGNVTSANNTGNGVDSKVSTLTFDLSTFQKSYVYRLPNDLEKAVKEFLETLNTECSTIEVFQTMFEIWVKANPNYDIRKIVPGIAKKAFWDSMKKAITFNAVKPIKHKLEVNTAKDNTDIVNLLSLLDENGISKEKFNAVLSKVKPHITKTDFSEKGLIDNDLFQEICAMLGFNTDNAAKYSKVKIYISRILSN